MLSLIGGCQWWRSDGPGVRTVKYACAGSAEFEARFTGEMRVDVTIAGEEQRLLKRVPAANGMRYSDGVIALTLLDNVAALEERGRPRLQNCRAR